MTSATSSRGTSRSRGLAVQAAVNAHLEGRTPSYACELRVQAKNGDWLWILDRGRVVEWDAAGQPQRMVGTHTDTTARKRAC